MSSVLKLRETKFNKGLKRFQLSLRGEQVDAQNMINKKDLTVI